MVTTNEQNDARPLTYGERAVGITFNPGGMPEVNKVKEGYAKVIDSLKEGQTATESNEQKRLFAIAITEAQTAQMWAVKALTWRD